MKKRKPLEHETVEVAAAEKKYAIEDITYMLEDGHFSGAI